MHNLLLIEDSPDGQLIVRKTLDSREYLLSIASTAQEAIALLDQQSFELILLDLMLPDSDGFSILTKVQSDPKTKHTPVIVLTGKTEITNKVIAFSLGADDYLVKPFNPLELKARVESKLKKMKEAREEGSQLQRGELRLDLGAQRAYAAVPGSGEHELKLTALEYKLLAYLAQRENLVLSRNQILDSVWGQDVQVIDRTVDTHIAALRKKLAALARYIESVPGTGYRFNSNTNR